MKMVEVKPTIVEFQTYAAAVATNVSTGLIDQAQDYALSAHSEWSNWTSLFNFVELLGWEVTLIPHSKTQKGITAVSAEPQAASSSSAFADLATHVEAGDPAFVGNAANVVKIRGKFLSKEKYNLVDFDASTAGPGNVVMFINTDTNGVLNEYYYWKIFTFRVRFSQ